MKVNDYENPALTHRNRLPSRAYFRSYASQAEAIVGPKDRSQWFQLLSGQWKFNYAPTPQSSPESFHKVQFDDTKWEEITVPGNWQMQGHGRPHYTNYKYPFPLDPPYVPTDNPTGAYRCRFEIPESWLERKTCLRFEGVDSAFHVWVNGKLVGFSKGSRLPSEFDITSFVNASSNVLAE